MNPWLRPENRKALEAVWSKFKFPCFQAIDFVDGTIVADEFESDVNMAALAWLGEHGEHGSYTLLFGNGAPPVTEQIIEEVKAWMDDKETKA